MQQRARLKTVASLLIIFVTVSCFVYFFRQNPEIGQQLRTTSPLSLIVLVGLYALFTACIGLILAATVRLCRASIPTHESILVTMYSAIINFFGPLQSGPAFRAAYLKKQHNVSLKLFGLATLGYYAAYGIINVILFMSSWSLWILWLIPLGLIIARYALPLLPVRTFGLLNLKGWLYLCIATALQVGVAIIIFYVELHGIDHSISLHQAIIYTGVANLALFVSLTPGAIGFRESFLFFSQRLHNVPTEIIISANILDRTAYIVLLLILAVCIFGTHARSRLIAATRK